MHSWSCHYGTGLFLELQTSSVVIVCCDGVVDRAAEWGCLHLDAYGEEDRGITRGKALRLSHIRLKQLVSEVAANNFKYLSRLHWTRHRTPAPHIEGRAGIEQN